LFHRAIIESGAVLRLTTREDAVRTTDLLIAELGLAKGHARELQNVPMARLLAANAAVTSKLTFGEPGMVANSPTVDGAVIPNHPWDPSGPALSANIPLLIGYARTEETLYDRPTPETRALDEAGPGGRGVGGVRANGESEYAGVAEVAGVFDAGARDHVVQQREPGGTGSRPRAAAGDGAAVEADVPTHRARYATRPIVDSSTCMRAPAQ